MNAVRIARALAGGERRAWDGPSWWANTLGQRRTIQARGTISYDRALTIGAVYACLRFISSTVSCMAVDVLRQDGGRAVRLSPAPQIVAAPSPRPQITAAEWLAQIIWSMRARGNAFGLVTAMSGSGWPTRIDVLDAGRVAYECKSGVERWWLHDETGRRSEVRLWQDGGVLWHLPFGTPPGGVIGIDVVSQAAIDLGLADSARQYAGDFYWSGGHPTAVLQSDQVLTGDQATEIQQRWADAVGSGNREPRVLGAGLSYQPLQVTPDQAALIEVMRASTADVCRWFDVPPEEIGGTSGSSSDYANIEGRGLQALRKLTPTIRAVQDAWTALLPRPQFVRLVPETLLMTNAKTKADIIAANIRGGIMTPNEGRALLDMPPVDGADELLWPPFSTTRAPQEVMP